MTTIRYAAFTLAGITLWCLTWTPPDNPAAFWLAGFFLTCFALVALTWPRQKENTMTIVDLERRVHLAQEAVEAAAIERNNTSMRIHSYRLQRAEEALRAARIAEGEA